MKFLSKHKKPLCPEKTREGFISTVLQSSEQLQEALMVTAVVDEIAKTDGWKSLDECFAKDPKRIDAYLNYADAALRAISRFNGSGQIRH